MKNTIKVLHNKFGRMELELAKAVTLPHGLIGISYATQFALLQCPMEKFQDFMVLQSTQEDSLSFMVMPVPVNDMQYYAPGILAQTCLDSGIAVENAIVLIILSVKRVEDKNILVANFRAPVLIDSIKKSGMQCVLQDNKYGFDTPI